MLFLTKQKHAKLVDAMLYELMLNNALPSFGPSDESKLLTASQLKSRNNGVYLQTVLQNHKNAQEELMIVRVNNFSQAFLDFDF